MHRGQYLLNTGLIIAMASTPVADALANGSADSFKDVSLEIGIDEGEDVGRQRVRRRFRDIAFNRVGPVASGQLYTTLTIGPDDNLYGLAVGGGIDRWPINEDGTLGDVQTLTSVVERYGPRLAIGLTFAPDTSDGELVAYVSHAALAFSDGPAWGGRLSRLSGPNLENEELIVTNLPRSTLNHVPNSIAFRPGDPDNLYILIPSNTTTGEADEIWGFRPERLLSAALLKLDLTRLPSGRPLDAQTSMSLSVINAADPNSPTMADGTYNPYAKDAPLTIYASGIRNGYDLAWHSNGLLYVPVNGGNENGSAPASVAGTRRPNGSYYSGPEIPQIDGIEAQRDFLLRINPRRPVGYFGHPNPLRGEYVLNRGSRDTAMYPARTRPDRNFTGFAYDFGLSFSPNGIIEYQSKGALRGVLLVTRFINGDDIIALVPSRRGRIRYAQVGIPGFTGFGDPLDLVEDTKTGRLYVSDFATAEIVLLEPVRRDGK